MVKIGREKNIIIQLSFMDKKDLQDYLNRWKLVVDAEDHELKNASFELMLKQTLSIWDIGRSLGFLSKSKLPNPLWLKLQIKWKEDIA